tara:strand:- start:2894 stop:3847 length:954 start_codon:yes stop_codon:yes gene_type:complete
MDVFVKAVDLGSFAATADALEISAPMVGKHIRFLEDRLGVRLLNRTTRRQSVTEFGRDYYERCRRILAEAEAADALATSEMFEPRGTLRVTASVHFGRHCVMPILTELLGQYPRLQLDLSLTDRLADLAEDGLDLAVRTGEPVAQAGMVGRRVARQRMIVCAAPMYLETNGYPLAIADISFHSGVVYRRSGLVAPWQFPAADGPPIEVLPATRLRMDDLAAIADAATFGAGLAWLPSWLVRTRLDEGALVEVLSGQSGFPYDVSALWLSSPTMLPKVRVAIDALAAQLPRMMGTQLGTASEDSGTTPISTATPASRG